MVDDLVACFRAGSDDEIQNTRRDSRGFEDFRDANGSSWGDRCRFEDDCVSRDERGCDLPHRNGDRKVPRSDAGNDAKRLLDRVGEVQRQLGRDSLAIHASRLARAKLRDVDRALQFAARLRDRLAFFMRQELRELFFALFHQTRSLRDDASARGRGCRSPTAKRLGGGVDGRARFLASRVADGADHVVDIRRIDVWSSAAGRRLDPFPVDKIAVSIHRSAGIYHVL